MTWAVPARVDRFDEAVDWFMTRTVLTKEQVARMEPSLRKGAFWIGAGLQADQVQRVMDEITTALETGEAFEEWRDRVRNDLFNDAHAETVFRNAVQRSYNAGRWEQMQDPDVAKFRPFLVFDAVLDDATTQICKDCNETILPRDDPWWETHVPPLHHRCRSGVRSLRQAEAERLGVTQKPPEQEPDGDWGEPPEVGEGWRPDRDRYEKRIAAEIERKRKLRELPPPLTPHEPDKWAEKYRKRYGDDAAKSIGWGRASYETGLDLPLDEVKQQLERLPRTEATRAMIGSLKGATGTLRRSGGELDPIRRAAAGTAGHLKAIPDRPKVSAPGVKVKRSRDNAEQFFTEMTGPNMVHPENYTFHRTKGVHAYHVGEDKFIQYRTAEGILEHEWSHALEYLNPKLSAAAVAFREARTKGLPLVELPVANIGAIGKEDEFVHPYIGRFYKWDSTEITSMGVELLVAGKRFWGTLEKLLRKDPEHFFFVLGQLAGP